MRDTKFRAWAKYGEMLDNVQNHIGNGSWAFGNILNSDDFIVMQFTGLKDKNGVEIYEGDIAKSTFLHFGVGLDVFGEVKFYESQYWLDDGESSVALFNELHDLEIIGNIHENPELLQETK